MKNNYDKIIKKHYDKVAILQKNLSTSTMQDKKIRKIETDFILEEISKCKKKSRILDIGCGNGYTLSRISKKFQSLELYGFEQNELLANLAKKELKKKLK